MIDPFKTCEYCFFLNKKIIVTINKNTKNETYNVNIKYYQKLNISSIFKKLLNNKNGTIPMRIFKNINISEIVNNPIKKSDYNNYYFYYIEDYFKNNTHEDIKEKIKNQYNLWQGT